MYIPEEFLIQDEATILAFLQSHSFGTCCATHAHARLTASQLPFVIEKENDALVFYTHVAKANPLSALENGDEVLLLFQGEHGYISSSWYASTNVPTWNYEAVHVYGAVQRQTPEELYPQLKKLTAQHEKEVDGHINPDELPERMIESYLQHILGLKITATRVEAQFKLSQNRNEKDFGLIIEQLEKRQPKLAERMLLFYNKKAH